MINFNKNPTPSGVQVSSKGAFHKRTPFNLKKKVTNNNKEFLKLVGLLK